MRNTLKWMLCLFVLAVPFRSGIHASTASTRGFPRDFIYCIYQDHNGALWLGTDVGLIGREKGKNTLYTTKDGLSGNTVTSLLEDRDHHLWVGTMGAGLNRYDRVNNSFTSYSSREHGLTGDMIYAIHQDKAGNIWIGTSTGLNRYSGGRFTSYTVNDGLSNNIVRAIAHDSENNLWIGTGGGGLNRFKRGKFQVFDTTKGLSHNSIVFIHTDREGVLWIGTLKGLNRFKDGVFTVYAGTNGLPGERVFQVLEHQNKHLWIGSESGIFRLRKKQLNDFADGKINRLHALVYTREDEQKSPVCAGGFQPSAIKAGDGNMYFSTLEGIAAFNPTRYEAELEPHFFKDLWFVIWMTFTNTLPIFIGFFYWVWRLRIRARELERQVALRTNDLEERNTELEHVRENILRSKEMMAMKNQQLQDQSEKLKEMDNIKSRFFANISHEFRTPLTLIMGPLEQMIADCPGENKDKKRKLTMMLRNAQRPLRLINQLLELSKLDSGGMKLRAGQINMFRFIKGITASFEILARQNELELELHAEHEKMNQAEEDEWLLYIDPHKMEDVMSNLLVNAVKFTPPGGKISVSLKKNSPGGFMEISVSDTGYGISSAQLDGIFDRFYQAESAHEHHPGGAGIGLALAKELVELHRGSIDARSSKGGGSEFTIRLPMGYAHLEPGEIVGLPLSETQYGGKISAEIPAIEMEENDEENGFEPGTGIEAYEKDIILVVEDSADVREYIRGALEPGYTVVGAKDGQDGMEKAREIIPDLIISDVMMPGTGGYE